MMAPGHQSYGDSESLQADVMRFMAIIAFCLIAILALVKNATPEEKAAASVEAPPPAPSPFREAAPAAEIELPLTAAPPVVEAEPQAEVAEVVPDPELTTAPTPDRPSEPLDAPVEQPSIEETLAAIEAATPLPPAAAAELEIAAAPEKTAATNREAAPEPSTSPVTASRSEEEEGLVLRFASDGDFLRLIARGDIKVYAFQERDVLTLNESYRFLDSSSPGQVYELLLPSIPGLVVDALRQARSDIDGYRWGIALPRHISNQIERHLNRVSRGELVIDRFGDVRHVSVAAS